ncbi:lipase [Sesbania bispinosa]|nr:lipase [Sesbania bispinosa]
MNTQQRQSLEKLEKESQVQDQTASQVIFNGRDECSVVGELRLKSDNIHDNSDARWDACRWPVGHVEVDDGPLAASWEEEGRRL